MNYKLNFEYDNKENKASFISNGFAVTRRNITTYEELAEFTSEVVKKMIHIPKMKHSERMIKNEIKR